MSFIQDTPPLPEKVKKAVGFENGLADSVSNLLITTDIEQLTNQLLNDLDIKKENLFNEMLPIYNHLHQKSTALETNVTQLNQNIIKIISKMKKMLDYQMSEPDKELTDTDIQLQILRLNQYLQLLSTSATDLNNKTTDLGTLRDEYITKLGLTEDKFKHNSFPTSTSESNLLEDKSRNSILPVAASPKMFAKLPKQIVESGVEKPELMRLCAVYELIETEIDYVKDLNTMINFHKVQMRDSKLIPESEINLIFSNVEQLVAANQILMDKLNLRKESNVFISEVGDLLIESAESFNVYSIYAANYPAAMKLVHSYQSVLDIKEALQKWVNAPEARGLSLESFLIKPVQRICKYPLLIRELEKYSDRAGNVKDTALLRTAAEKIEVVVKNVNEATRAAEERQRILNLGDSLEPPMELSDKVYIKDGTMVRLTNGKPKDRYVILYTDVILICQKIVTTNRGPSKYEVENGYSLAELSIRNDGKFETIKGHPNKVISFTIISEDKDVLMLSTNSPEEFSKWADAFHIAFKDITEEHRSAVRSLIETQKRTVEKASPEGLGFSAITKSKPLTKSIGLSTVAARNVQSRKSALHFRIQQASSNEINEPEYVKIQGSIHKRALAATGHSFYFSISTKQSIWKLPDDYIVIHSIDDDQRSLLSVDNKEIIATDNFAALGEEDDDINVDIVEGFPNWKRVDRGDGMPYYFHVNTQETRWDPPTSN
ncbi:hypothetical protein BC833DRAFT_623172 [Globomyces pollinis-pini]|nr:hypothetical protein BC833DRAFT_623172 [Globomyces pollinis-pini]